MSDELYSMREAKKEILENELLIINNLDYSTIPPTRIHDVGIVRNDFFIKIATFYRVGHARAFLDFVEIIKEM